MTQELIIARLVKTRFAMLGYVVLSIQKDEKVSRASKQRPQVSTCKQAKPYTLVFLSKDRAHRNAESLKKKQGVEERSEATHQTSPRRAVKPVYQ